MIEEERREGRGNDSHLPAAQKQPPAIAHLHSEFQLKGSFIYESSKKIMMALLKAFLMKEKCGAQWS